MPEVNSQVSKKSTRRFVVSIYRWRVTIPLKLTAERNDVVVLCFHFNAFRLALISNVKPGAFWDSCFEIYSQSTAGIAINNDSSLNLLWKMELYSCRGFYSRNSTHKLWLKSNMRKNKQIAEDLETNSDAFFFFFLYIRRAFEVEFEECWGQERKQTIWQEQQQEKGGSMRRIRPKQVSSRLQSFQRSPSQHFQWQDCTCSK